jgi:hypothetical protein
MYDHSENDFNNSEMVEYIMFRNRKSLKNKNKFKSLKNDLETKLDNMELLQSNYAIQEKTRLLEYTAIHPPPIPHMYSYENAKLIIL